MDGLQEIPAVDQFFQFLGPVEAHMQELDLVDIF